MDKKIATTLALCAVMGLPTFAAEEVSEQADNSAWTIRAGYAWRARARTSFKSSNWSPIPVGGVYDNGHYSRIDIDGKDWSTTEGFNQTRFDNPTTVGDHLNALGLVRSESIGGGHDDEGQQGFNFSVGYDLYSGDTFDVSAVLSFAGYWGLENGCAGGYRRYADYFTFEGGPSVGDGFNPEPGVDSATYREREYLVGSANPHMKLEADLYQIGLGPQFTWHVFNGWCDTLDWIDVYGGVEVLCNIIHSDFTAGGASTDETNCRVGVGGQVGIIGNITDWCGIYGQVGYEWIEEDKVSTMGCSAETDYSSLILSIGLQFRF